MKNPDITELLLGQINIYRIKVLTLSNKISVLESAIEALKPEETETQIDNQQKSIKKILDNSVSDTRKMIKEKKVSEPIKGKAGIKFSTFVLSILKNKSHKTFTSKEIKQIVADAVAKGKVIYSGKKDLVSTISASLHSQFILGKIEKFKTDDGMSYKYNTAKVIVTNSDADELMIDKILEFTKDKSLSDTEISKKLFMDTDYMDIAKNLNGSLNSCTKKCLNNLLRDKKIDQDIEGKYFSI